MLNNPFAAWCGFLFLIGGASVLAGEQPYVIRGEVVDTAPTVKTIPGRRQMHVVVSEGPEWMRGRRVAVVLKRDAAKVGEQVAVKVTGTTGHGLALKGEVVKQ